MPPLDEEIKALRKKWSDEGYTPPSLPEANPEGKPLRWDQIQPKLKKTAEDFETVVGFKPTYTSGFRTQAEQDALKVPGKAKVSRHSSGRALDEGIAGLNQDQINKALGYYNSQPGFKAAVHNNNHIHVDYLGDDELDPSTQQSANQPTTPKPVDPKLAIEINQLRKNWGGSELPTPTQELIKTTASSVVSGATKRDLVSEVNELKQKWGVEEKPQTVSSPIPKKPVVFANPLKALSTSSVQGSNNLRPFEGVPGTGFNVPQEEVKQLITDKKYYPIAKFIDTPLLSAEPIKNLFNSMSQIPSGFGNIQAELNQEIINNPTGLHARINDVGAGIRDFSANTISGLTTPKNIAIGAVAPIPILGPAVIGSQIPGMIGGAADSLGQTVDRFGQGDYRGGTEAILNTIANIAMTAGGTKYAVGNLGKLAVSPFKKSVPVKAEPVAEQLPAEVAIQLEQKAQPLTLSSGKPRQPESIYLGSGLGGLQRLFEKDPVVKARLDKVAEIEQQAKASGKKMHEVLREQGENFDPDLYAEVMNRQREVAREAEKSSLVQRASDLKRELKVKLVDSVAPLEDALRTWEKNNPEQAPFGLSRTERLTDRIDKSFRAVNMAGQFMKDNGLEGVIKSLENVKDLDVLDQYLIAKHAPEREVVGKTSGRDLELDRQFLEAKAPQFEEHAKVVQNYAQKLLDYSVDAGLISKESAARLKEQYPNYVPLNRVFNELEVVPSSFKPKGPASLSKQTVVQKSTGSLREIESPIASLMEKTADAFMQGERNKTTQYLVEQHQLEGNPFGLRKLKPDEKPSEGMGKVELFRNGEKEIWETDPEIAAAAKSLNVQQFGLLARILRKPSLVFKAGTTGVNPVFALMNLIKDTGHALTLSKNSRGGALSTPFGLKQALKGGEFSDMLAREGAMDSSFDPFREQFLKNVKEIRSDRDLASKIKFRANPLHILKNIEDVINVGERTTRIAQAKAAYDAAIKAGLSPADAQIKAALAARKTTTDFYRKGEWGAVLNSVSPYLNAGIQGSRTLVRRLHESPGKTTAKIVALAAVPSALATLYNLNDPERKKIYADLNEKEKDDNIVIITPWASFNEKTKQWDGVIKIPKPQGISNLIRPMTKYIEHLHDVDPQTVGSMAKEFLSAGTGAVLPFEPSVQGLSNFLIPPPLKGVAENLYNKDFYFNKPIVPDYIDRQPSKDLPPERQTLPNTSFVANKVGQTLGVSPLKVDHLIKSTFGGMGYTTTRAVDAALNLTGIASDDEVKRLEGKPWMNLLTLGTGPEFVRRLSQARGGELDKKVATEAQEVVQQGAARKQDVYREAKAFLDEGESLPREVANARFDQIKKEKPDVAKKILQLSKEKKANLSSADKAIMALGAEDGTRARFLYNHFNKLDSEEGKAVWEELKQKGILTDKVIQQIKELKASRGLRESADEN